MGDALIRAGGSLADGHTVASILEQLRDIAVTELYTKNEVGPGSAGGNEFAGTPEEAQQPRGGNATERTATPACCVD